MQFGVIVYQISVLGILALIGIFTSRKKILPENARQTLHSIVFSITLPLLIISSLSRLEITNEILLNGGFVIIFSYLAIFLQLFIGYFSAKALKLKDVQANLHQVHTFFGNIVFLGFPLIDALFPGGEALLYAALYQLVTNTILWTIGVLLLSRDKNKGITANVKKLINPNTIALTIGFLMMILKFKLPPILEDSLGNLGKTTLYLAMLYIGILLGESKIVSVLSKIQTFILSFNKLFLIPVILMFMILGLQKLLGFDFSFVPFSVVIIEAATPCGTILVIIAKNYGSDDKLAMENVVLSTIISLISLPFIYFMLETFVN
jgi:predicted permease